MLKTFSNHADTVVISAAPPGQGGEGHFNEQLPEYWIRKFEKFGYHFEEEKTAEFKKTNDLFCENMLVFER